LIVKNTLSTTMEFSRCARAHRPPTRATDALEHRSLKTQQQTSFAECRR